MTSIFKIRHIPSGRFAKKTTVDPFNITYHGIQSGIKLDFTRKAPPGDVWNSFKIAEKFRQCIPHCSYKDYRWLQGEIESEKFFVPLEELEVVEFELVEKK